MSRWPAMLLDRELLLPVLVRRWPMQMADLVSKSIADCGSEAAPVVNSTNPPSQFKFQCESATTTDTSCHHLPDCSMPQSPAHACLSSLPCMRSSTSLLGGRGRWPLFECVLEHIATNWRNTVSRCSRIRLKILRSPKGKRTRPESTSVARYEQSVRLRVQKLTLKCRKRGAQRMHTLDSTRCAHSKTRTCILDTKVQRYFGA